MDGKVNYTKLNKEVSQALRHVPCDYELELAKNGWVLTDQLLRALHQTVEWQNVTIERFKPTDITELIQLFYQTIEEINSQDYSKSQLQAWQGKHREDERSKQWSEKLCISKTLIARNKNQEISGFLELEPSGELNLFFVHARYQRQGIGQLLMEQLLTEVNDTSLKRLTANVSITAVPFFEAVGFKKIQQQIVSVDHQEFINYRMEKELM